MKNICLIIDTLGGGGAEKVVITLATTLSNLGHHVHVIVLNNIISYNVDKINFHLHILRKKKKTPD